MLSLNHVCCSLRIQPSEDDLLDHVSLLCEAMKRDEDLTKSKVCFLFGLSYLRWKGFNWVDLFIS